MSASAALISCPICAHHHFNTADALRERLIFVSNNKLACPICQEQVLGLDKLTIHLFTHIKIPLGDTKDKAHIKKEAKPKPKPETASANVKRTRPTPKYKAPSVNCNTPVKFVKICPKPPIMSLNTVPLIEITQKSMTPPTQIPQPIYIPCIPPNLQSDSTNRENIEQQKDFRCNLCGNTFSDDNMLTMHKNLIHDLDGVKTEDMTNFPCHLCSKVFKMRGSLMVHLRVAHYGMLSRKADLIKKNNDSSKPPMEQSEKVIEKFDQLKGWYCEICKKSFTTKYFLKKHKRLHTGETPYACSICNKTFTFQQSYHKHLLYHNDEKPHSCSHCGRAFKELSTLHNHQRIHTGEKPFACETCGKCFRQRVSYLVHRRIHTGAMPYKCTACEKSFRYKVSQRTHKCLAQPPGKVVRQTGDLLEKLIHRRKSTDSNVPLMPVISEASAELVRTGAKLSLEDTEVENFSLIAKTPFDNGERPNLSNRCDISNNPEQMDIASSGKNTSSPIQESVPSPSEILKNLCLSNDESSPLPDEELFCQNDINIQEFCREIDGLL